MSKTKGKRRAGGPATASKVPPPPSPPLEVSPSSPVPDATGTGPSRAAMGGLVLCLLLSGAAGLVYETVWTRQLGYYFSGTAVTSCLVLSAFMGGMAIGSWLAGRLAARLSSPLGVYGFLELGLAVCGAVYPRAIERVGAFYLNLASGTDPSTALFAARFLLFGALLTIPAMLMGATLPLVVALVVSRRELAGRGLGVLYAMNSLGGVLGCLAAGFVLIEAFGLTLTSNLGALANAAAGLLALSLRSRLEKSPVVEVVVQEASATAVRAGRGRLAFVLAISGFTAMAYEVLWARTLPLILGSSTYSFALMLATFVTGVTIGSLAYSWLGARLPSPLRVVAGAQIAIGVWVLVTMPAYRWLPWPFVFVRTAVDASFATFQLMAVVINGAVMFVPAVLFGLGFPAAVQAATEESGVSRAVGDLYAANTVGNVLGSMAAGLFLIPSLGTPLTFQLCAVANLLSGIALVPGIVTALGLPTASAALLVLLVSVLPESSRAWLNPLAVGGFSRMKNVTWSEAQRQVRYQWSNWIAFSEEDTTGMVVVTERKKQRALWRNGKVDASNTSDMDTQLFLSLLPVMMLENPRSVFVLGLGSGVTTGAALLDPRVQRVDACEISSAVVNAARLFDDVNFKPWEDKRARIFVDDGRHFLATHPDKYDVITLEPSNPWMAGISSLYTREFLTLCKSRLADDGLMVQWSHLYEIDARSITMVARTFQETFPHARAFLCGFDLILVGATRAETLDPKVVTERVARRYREPHIKAVLDRDGYTELFTLFATELFDSRTLRAWTGPGIVLTDDNPELEFSAPVAYYNGEKVMPPSDHLPLQDALLSTYLGGRRPSTQELESWGRVKVRQNHVIGGPSALLALALPNTPTLDHIVARMYMKTKELAAALMYAQRAALAKPDSVEFARTWYEAARAVEDQTQPLLTTRTWTASIAAVHALQRLLPADPHLAVDEAVLAVAVRNLEVAETALKRAEKAIAAGTAGASDMGGGMAQLWQTLALRWRERGDLDRARAALHHALALSPGRIDSRELLEELADESDARGFGSIAPGPSPGR